MCLPLIFPEGISRVEIIGPTGVLIADNSTANLSCQATGGTVGDIDWLKDGKPLGLSSPRVVFAADESSMLIRPLQKDDNGKFTCRVSNAVSSKEAHYNMQVVCKCLLRYSNMCACMCLCLTWICFY